MLLQCISQAIDCARAAETSADSAADSATAAVLQARALLRSARLTVRRRKERPIYVQGLMDRKRKAEAQLAPHMLTLTAVHRELNIAGVTLKGEDTRRDPNEPWGAISSSCAIELINAFEVEHAATSNDAFASAEYRMEYAKRLAVAPERGVIMAAVDDFIAAHTQQDYVAHIQRHVNKLTLPKLVLARSHRGEREREWFILRVMMLYNAKLKRLTTLNAHVATFDAQWHAQRMKDFDARMHTFSRMYKRHATYKGGRLHFECVS